MRRLWLQSMTAESIRAAFEHLRSDEEMQPLADAAVCRSRERLAGRHQRHPRHDRFQ